MALTRISTDGIKDGTITGVDLATNVDLVDNKKIRFGTGNDLAIYHDGTNSIIDNTTGELRIQTDGTMRMMCTAFNVVDENNSDTIINAQSDGAVEIYYDNSKKFETTSTGITVSGSDTTGSIVQGDFRLKTASGTQHIVYDASNSRINFADSINATFGDANDLQIFHNGTRSKIQNETGDFRICGNDIKVKNFDDDETYLTCVENGAVELYYDNSKKFETTSFGAQFTDNVKFDNPDTAGRDVLWAADYDSMRWQDNTKATFGDSDDLQIYHNGSESWIKNNTGTLNVLNDGVFQFKNLADNETIAQFEADGACSLWYNNSKKFETTASGVDVTGNCTITGNFRGNDGVMLNLGNGDDLQIYHDGTDDRIMSGSTNSTIFASKYLRLMNQAANETMAKFFENGAVELNYDNSKKLETKSDGVLVTGEIQATTLDINGNGHIDGTLQLTNDLFLGDNDILKIGSGNDLQLYHDGSDSYITDDGPLIIRGDGLQLQRPNGNMYLKCIAGNTVELYYDNSKKLKTHPNGIFTQGIYPMSDNTYDIGSGSERFDDIFATNGTIQTSDENAKKDIVTSDLGLTFINAVKPVSYKFKTGTRTHYGVIAQDLETVLDGKDFAGLIKDTETNNYGIRYTELIAPLIKAVQELSAEVAALKAS